MPTPSIELQIEDVSSNLPPNPRNVAEEDNVKSALRQGYTPLSLL
jgi:hypothetical protein